MGKRRNYKKELEVLEERFKKHAQGNAELMGRYAVIDAENYKLKQERDKLRSESEKMWWIIYDLQNFLHARFDDKMKGENRDAQTEFFFDYIDSKCNLTQHIFVKRHNETVLKTREEIEKENTDTINFLKFKP